MHVAEPAKRSVVLVHGILGQRHVYWNLLHRRMRREGFRVHEAVFPYMLLGDLRLAARFLKDKVDATLRGDGVEHVDLVCHSAGGLVARYYLAYLDGARHVDHCVTLGAPHQGTWFSYFLGFPVSRLVDVTRQTRPGSHFLQEITEATPGVRITNLWSPIDGVVVPAKNAVLEGANNVRIATVTHWGFLWRPDVHDQIVAALHAG